MTTARSRRLPLATAGLVLVLSGAAACSSSGSSSSSGGYGTTSNPTSSPAPAPTAGGGAALKVGGLSQFAKALTDSNGRALYLFVPDKQGASTCSGACAQTWPPLTTTGTPTMTGGTMAELGTQKRADGTTQVTYNHWPLYYYAGDQGPGTATGEGNTSFGGAWYLIGTDGNMITNG